MGCLGECWELGPPPDSILNLPPPPIPAFIQHSLADLLLNTTPCSSTQLCEGLPPANRAPSDGGEFVEMPRKEIESWSVSAIDDTWLLVLVASSIGVLLLGALLAMFLLKCREMSMFDGTDCSMHSNRDHHRSIKSHEPRECTSLANLNGNGKLVHPSDSVLYHHHHQANLQDNRMVWAALTPHGTQHFIGDNYPRDFHQQHHNQQAIENDDSHYETIDHVVAPTPPNNYYHTSISAKDYDYEEPAPLIESYQLADLEHNHHYASIGNTDMRCASLGMRRHGRPRVSSPTRIEHPNLPPLNLYPHNAVVGGGGGNTLKRSQMMGGAYHHRAVDGGATLPKYGC